MARAGRRSAIPAQGTAPPAVDLGHRMPVRGREEREAARSQAAPLDTRRSGLDGRCRPIHGDLKGGGSRLGGTRRRGEGTVDSRPDLTHCGGTSPADSAGFAAFGVTVIPAVSRTKGSPARGGGLSTP